MDVFGGPIRAVALNLVKKTIFRYNYITIGLNNLSLFATGARSYDKFDRGSVVNEKYL